jgi:hypothetical protein
MLGQIFTQYFESPNHPCTCCYGCGSGAAKIRVIEISQAIGGGTYLSTHAAFFPSDD